MRDVKKPPKEIGGITTWLYKAFSQDSEQYGMSVMALFNRSHLAFWDVMSVEKAL
jgi:hypothetical protein